MQIKKSIKAVIIQDFFDEWTKWSFDEDEKMGFKFKITFNRGFFSLDFN